MRNQLTALRKFVFSGYFSGFENADTVIRYAPIADEISNSELPAPSILEIGSGPQGIARYVPFPVTGVDVTFDGEIHPNLHPVCRSGTKLPFDDGAFDYVVSVDMLEHVPSDGRLEVIREMIRVARRKVFLAVPCGASAERQDRVLNEKYLASKGEYYRYLQEHVVNGLPDFEEIASLIQVAAADNGASVAVTTSGNFNLRLRYVLMRLWLDETFYVPYLMLSWFLCLMKNSVSPGSCYRRIFKIDLTEEQHAGNNCAD